MSLGVEPSSTEPTPVSVLDLPIGTELLHVLDPDTTPLIRNYPRRCDQFALLGVVTDHLLLGKLRGKVGLYSSHNRVVIPEQANLVLTMDGDHQYVTFLPRPAT